MTQDYVSFERDGDVAVLTKKSLRTRFSRNAFNLRGIRNPGLPARAHCARRPRESRRQEALKSPI